MDSIILLLVESDASYAHSIQEALDCNSFKVEWVTRLSDGLKRLSEEEVGAVLLNLSLPDSKGIETFEKAFSAAPHLPILVFCDATDEEIARQAVHLGAQDYVLSGHIDRYWLPRALRNMIERKTLKEALFLEKERAQVMLNSIGDAVLSTDISGNVTYLNLIAESMTGWPWKEASGRPFAEVCNIIDGTTREASRSALELAIHEGKATGLATNSILVRRDGLESSIEDTSSPIRDREGRVTGGVMVFHDVNAARAMALQMSHLAQHDCLTDLPNRILFKDLLTRAIGVARRHKNKLAVFFVDLDRFKNLNNAVGHVIGDKLLQSVAKRLAGTVRSSDGIGRLGADEFVAMATDVEQAQDAAHIARKLLSAFEAPHVVDNRELFVTASIGVSLYPDDFEDAETLLQAADTAMHVAKEKGRNTYQFFKYDMNVRAVQRQSVEGVLHGALERKEFHLHYQPKVNLQTGEITGAEALIRWHHPDRGLIPPAQFLSIAEECGLIVPIGRWVLNKACTQARAWINAGSPPMPIAVNISAVEFRNEDFLSSLRSILTDTRLDPRYLEIELTEGVLMQDSDSSVSILQALRAMGVKIALDDFGTGYSSLSYLKRFPIDVLKIDQSFIREIKSTETAIIRAVIGIARSLGQRVVAEGIETREQFDFLRAQHCDEGQGYYFSPPVVAEQFAALRSARIPETVLA